MFLYPGHKYLGPGNKFKNGTPVDEADEIARKHDYSYIVAKTKEDIFNSDKEAISEFNKSYKSNFNLPSFVGSVGLNLKHFTESTLNRTIYPWNMPPGSKRPSNSGDQEVPNKQVNAGSISAPGGSTSEISMDTDDIMVGDQPLSADPSSGKGGGGSLHGQTAQIFSGYPQEPSWTTLTFKKTYRWTYKSSLPAWKYDVDHKKYQFDIGSAISIPVNHLYWYISPGEYWQLKQYDIVECLHAKNEIYNYGIRLPFATNDSSSTMANASAQYPLCQWLGLEEDYDITHTEDDEKTAAKCYGKNSDFVSTQTDWTTTFLNLSARATSRKFERNCILMCPQSNTNVVYIPNTNEYAHVVNGTMNLGKVFEWSHKCKNGLIGQKHNPESSAGAGILIDLSTFPNFMATKGMSNVNVTKPEQETLDNRTVYRGISDDTQPSTYNKMKIDGNIVFGRNASNITQTKIKPFIVGMQFLRNKDESLIESEWEFCTVSYLTVRVKTGCRGLYNHFLDPNHYVGLEPSYTLGTTNKVLVPSDASTHGYTGQYVQDYNPAPSTTTTTTTSQSSTSIQSKTTG